MGGETCHQKGREKGRWFEIESVKQVIINKEARGEDATFERNLLKEWAKYEGWQDAVPRIATKSNSRRLERETIVRD